MGNKLAPKTVRDIKVVEQRLKEVIDSTDGDIRHDVILLLDVLAYVHSGRTRKMRGLHLFNMHAEDQARYDISEGKREFEKQVESNPHASVEAAAEFLVTNRRTADDMIKHFLIPKISNWVTQTLEDRRERLRHYNKVWSIITKVLEDIPEVAPVAALQRQQTQLDSAKDALRRSHGSAPTTA